MGNYDFEARGRADADTSPEALLRHRGDAAALMRRYQTHVVAAHRREGLAGVRACAPHLAKLIADPRVLRVAWDHLARWGGQAPGPDNLRYPDLNSAEAWDLCRALGRAIRAGDYRRGRDRVVMIAKGAGRGERPLVLSSVADRVVDRAAASILGPLLDPLFDPNSFGSRPRVDRLHALAAAERCVLGDRRRVWLTHDIRDAFLHVPRERLLQAVQKFLPADDLIELLGHLIDGNRLPGLRQGSPLSPLLLNLYLHHVLDRPWRRERPGLPLLRYVDDLLVPCRSEAQAHSADAVLRRLLVPAGLPLKWSPGEAIADLGTGGTVRWMGFVIRKVPRALAAEIAETAWEDLETRLAGLHAEGDAPLRAAAVIPGWIGQRGPCYRWSDRAAACRRVVAIAAAQAFEEVPGEAQLEGFWQRAHARYCRLQGSAKAAGARAASNEAAAAGTTRPASGGVSAAAARASLRNDAGIRAGAQQVGDPPLPTDQARPRVSAPGSVSPPW